MDNEINKIAGSVTDLDADSDWRPQAPEYISSQWDTNRFNATPVGIGGECEQDDTSGNGWDSPRASTPQLVNVYGHWDMRIAAPEHWVGQNEYGITIEDENIEDALEAAIEHRITSADGPWRDMEEALLRDDVASNTPEEFDARDAADSFSLAFSDFEVARAANMAIITFKAVLEYEPPSTR